MFRRRQWHPTPILLPGNSHGWSLVGCSPWGREESDTTERLHFHVSLSCLGEGNGNPLQCSCLENPRDGGAWWPAVYGVAQSQTWLTRLSSSSRAIRKHFLGKEMWAEVRLVSREMGVVSREVGVVSGKWVWPTGKGSVIPRKRNGRGKGDVVTRRVAFNCSCRKMN